MPYPSRPSSRCTFLLVYYYYSTHILCCQVRTFERHSERQYFSVAVFSCRHDLAECGLSTRTSSGWDVAVFRGASNGQEDGAPRFRGRTNPRAGAVPRDLRRTGGHDVPFRPALSAPDDRTEAIHAADRLDPVLTADVKTSPSGTPAGRRCFDDHSFRGPSVGGKFDLKLLQAYLARDHTIHCHGYPISGQAQST